MDTSFRVKETVFHKLYVVLAMAIIATAAIRFWSFSIASIRLSITDLLSLSLLTVFAIDYSATGKKIFQLSNRSQRIVASLWGLNLTSILITAPLIIGSAYASLAIIQFFKGFSQFLIYASLIIAFVRIGSNQPELFASRLPKVYLSVGVASVFFEFLEVYLFIRGVDIHQIIWPLLTLGSHDPLAEGSPSLYQWSDFIRCHGFAGTNSQAAFLVTCLPLSLYRVVYSSKSTNIVISFLLLIGIALTQSRSGALAAVFIMGAFFILKPSISSIATGFCIIFISILAFFNFSEEISEALLYRSFVDTERINLTIGGLSILKENPLGIGYMQYAVYHMSHIVGAGVTDFNLHNNWLQYLVELGPVGFLLKFLFFATTLFLALKSKSRYGLPFAVGLCSLILISLFNNILEETFARIFYATFLLSALSASVIPSSNKSAAKPIKAIP